MTVDSSLLGLVDLGALAADDPRVEATMNQVEERLWVHTDVGGLARFENDAYHQLERQDTKRVPGNPWFISTLWLARYRLLRSHTAKAPARGPGLVERAPPSTSPPGGS